LKAEYLGKSRFAAVEGKEEAPLAIEGDVEAADL